MRRRAFIKAGLGAAISAAAWSNSSRRIWAAPSEPAVPFKISLAQWSLNSGFFGRGGETRLDPLDFAKIAHDLDIEGLEYVNQFYKDKADDKTYLAELKKRADDHGRRSVLIMVDNEGNLGDPDAARRARAIENHVKWLDWAKFLGAHGIRVNAYSEGTYEEQQQRVTDGLRVLGERGREMGLNVFVENHGGNSSNPEWLVGVIKGVGLPNVGTLPDFGNFRDFDPYRGTELMMPFAFGVSAKARFNADGAEQTVDYDKMMRIVRDAGWNGYVGIESSRSNGVSEMQAVRFTKALLERVREQQSRVQPILGDTLAGWKFIGGGDHRYEQGVLTLTNGRNWSTNPEVAGSWLYYDEQLKDFRLEFQYRINERGNSGVFFRSALEKNPAFTGYEMQISSNQTPQANARGTSGAVYNLVAPNKNAARPADEWNTVTLIAEGRRTIIELNHDQIIDAELDRSLVGYIGLQNHDERSVAQFKNVRLQKLSPA